MLTRVLADVTAGRVPTHDSADAKCHSGPPPDYSVTVSPWGEVQTLYEWAGGRPAIERMIGCFYDRVERHDLVVRGIWRPCRVHRATRRLPGHARSSPRPGHHCRPAVPVCVADEPGR